MFAHCLERKVGNHEYFATQGGTEQLAIASRRQLIVVVRYEFTIHETVLAKRLKPNVCLPAF